MVIKTGFLSLLLNLFQYNLFSQQIPYGSNQETGTYISINGIKIYYETYGSGEPLLLLHGNSQSIKDWQYQILEFSKYYKVIVPDSRAQGKSTDADQPLTYELMATDMSLLLDSLHIENTNIVGWSDGGNTALHMTLQHPEKVKKLITVGANFKIDTTAISSELIDLLKSDFSKETDPKQKKLIELMLNYPKLSESDLSKIQSSVIVMAGEHDIILAGHTQKLAAAISNSKLEIFKDAGHFIPHENPELFNHVVLKYLNTKLHEKIIGSVRDLKSNEPIPSVNVYFNKSKEGTSTDLSGDFELEMLSKEDSIKVSSVGYESKAISLRQINLQPIILLKPKDYLLKEVLIKSKPLTPIAILKQAIKNLDKNYPQDKYGLEMYVNQEWQYNDGQPTTRCEGILQGFNQTGYSRRVHAYFHLLNKFYFKLVEQRRQNVKDSAWIMPYQMDIMYNEVIRFNNNPINSGNLKNYDLQFENILERGKDTIYVISFKCKDPNYWNTAQTYSSDYFGEVYINSKDFAITKYKATNIADRDVLEKKGEKMKYLRSNVQEQFEVNYVKHQGVYFPSMIESDAFNYKGNDRTPIVNFKSKTIVYSLNLKNPIPIEPPKNFKAPAIKNVSFNEKFWGSFSVPMPLANSN
jgi:alpha-beta hydrolase superfamily lysophospholipase